MKSNGLRATAVAWAVGVSIAIAAGSSDAGPTVIDVDTLIDDGDLTFENQDIIVRGATVTINGAHTFNSLVIERDGATPGLVTHDAGFTNGPMNGLFLTITTDLFVQGEDKGGVGSRIDVDARGFAPGEGPGAGADGGGSIGAAGGGHGGAGGDGNGGPLQGGVSYGDPFAPTMFGSGGGFYGGAGPTGGGAVRLDVGGTATIDGEITANGQFTNSTGGAGGSIWLDAGVLQGSGVIRSIGGASPNGSWGSGGGGRIALIANDLSGYTGAIQAFGGGGGGRKGGAGTIFLETIGGDRTMRLDNDGRVGEVTEISGATAWDCDVIVRGEARLGHREGDAGAHLMVTGNVNIEADGWIMADARGYAPGMGPGVGADGGGSAGAAGGGHGGAGGDNNTGDPLAGGVTYGDPFAPVEFGSGSGLFNGSGGARGGGAFRLTSGGDLNLDGVATANGQSLNSAAGAGGSLWLEAAALTGAGVIRANGGSGVNGSWGDGGGGRIAIDVDDDSGFGGMVSAFAGGGAGRNAGAGTIVVRTAEAAHLIIDNNGNSNAGVTEISGAVLYDSNLIVRGEARLGHREGDAGVHLAVTGDVDVQADGWIDVGARGHEPGMGPGAGADSDSAGFGSAGGGHGGAGGDNPLGPLAGGMTYGDPFAPVDFGSGSGLFLGGGGARGGGAFRLTADGVINIDGVATANGQSLNNAAGAGGSLWLEAAALSGAGVVRANGGNGVNSGWGSGGGGRIAVEVDNDAFAGSLQSYGGAGSGQRGGPGTVFVHVLTQPRGDLIIDNNGVAGGLCEISGDVAWDANVIILNEGRLGHREGDAGVHLAVTGDVDVQADGWIDVGARGHEPGMGPGAGADSDSAGFGSAGGGHGGAGGDNPLGPLAGGMTYGDPFAPVDFGSGSGLFLGGGGARGGGAFRLTADGVINIDGVATANGQSLNNAAGAGGSLWLEAAVLSGAGVVRANGGNGVNSSWGSGGGGRIAVEVDNDAFAGSLQSYGGAGGGQRGGPGTVFVHVLTQPRGDLIIDNNGVAGDLCEISGDVAWDANLIIRNEGRLGHPWGEAGLHLTVTGDVDVEPDGFLAVIGRGFAAGQGPGVGGDGGGSAGEAGGGHGGMGGDSNGAIGGGTYGSAPTPTDLGSGSGLYGDSGGARGGGAIRLTVDGALTVDGELSANGQAANNGAGSGGSLWIRASSVTGNGVIRANGGNANSPRGGGGGGRVAIYSCDFTFSPENVTANGGNGFDPGDPGSALILSDSVDFLGQPADQSANNGDTVVFTAQAIGDGVITYQWRRDGVLLEDGAGVSGTQTDTLTLDNVTCADSSGVYDVIVNDDCGFGLSDAAVLVIPVTGDLNGDCVVGPADLAVLLSAWGPCPKEGDCVADIDGDGVVGPSDLATLLANWG